MSVTPAPVVAALNALQSAINAAGTLQGASDDVLAPVVDAALAATAVINAQIDATDALIGNGSGLSGGAGMDGGVTAANAIAYLNANIAACLTQYNLLTMQALVQRISLNIAANF